MVTVGVGVEVSVIVVVIVMEYPPFCVGAGAHRAIEIGLDGSSARMVVVIPLGSLTVQVVEMVVVEVVGGAPLM